ncbi:MAG: hypothetical protein JWR26_1702 [Pedosphaera sp.]|nr:hypothetical protein [Pedosphaera sp.]
MSKLLRFRRPYWPVVGILLLMHWVLLHWLAERNVVTVLLAAGNQGFGWTLAMALFFVMVRIVAVFFLPGIILYRLGWHVFDRVMKLPKDAAAVGGEQTQRTKP